MVGGSDSPLEISTAKATGHELVPKLAPLKGSLWVRWRVLVLVGSMGKMTAESLAT